MARAAEKRLHRQPRLRSQALARRRQAAQQHGRGGIQARRPRPDLPQVHLRHLRGTPRQARSRARATTPARIPKIRTNTKPRMFSGFRPPRAGPICRTAPSSPTIGKMVDDAMVAIERDNPRLKGVLPEGLRPPRPRQTPPRRTDRPHRPPSSSPPRSERRDRPHRSVDLLGRVYEYFLTRFASAEGKNGGQFYTPPCVVRCSSRCSRPTKAASTTLPAAPAACSCSRRNSSKPTAASSATSASTARRATPPPAASP